MKGLLKNIQNTILSLLVKKYKTLQVILLSLEHNSQPYPYLGGISKSPPSISCAEENGCF